MTLKNLSNDELHLKTKTAAEKERLTTIEVLWHLRENDRRMLYAQMGYRDLKEYCIKELKFSEGSAWRRISAMKLLMDTPEIEAKIQLGELNLTQISMAQTHFREVNATQEERKEILTALENQTSKSTERILAERKPEGFTPKPEVTEKAIKGRKVEVTLILDEEMQNQLDEIQTLLGRSYSKLELFKMMTDETLKKLKQDNLKQEKLEPKKRKAQPVGSQTVSAKSRSIPKSVLREVKERDGGRCQFCDPVSGRQCEARLNLEVEHLVPFAKGGTHDPSNLQLLCKNHNQLRAVQHFGADKMKAYLSSLQ